MSLYQSNYLLLLKRLVLVFALFFLSRLLFFFFNYSAFDGIQIGEFLKICFWGLRFDMSAIAYSNMLFVLLAVLPGNFVFRRGYQAVLKYLFVVINSLLMLASTADFEFFKYSKKRLSSFVLDGMAGDAGGELLKQIPHLFVSFWYLTLLWIGFIVLLVKFSGKLKDQSYEKPRLSIKNISVQFFVMLVFVALVIIGGRGGFGVKPLAIINASEHASARDLPLVLNTPFTIIRSINKNVLEKKHYFTEQECNTYFSVEKHFSSNKPFDKKNVLVLILESFGSEYCGFANDGKGYTPFLDSLAQHSLVYPRGFANGTQSIHALPSIFAGIPGLMEKPYVVSAYVSNQINSLPFELNKKGYSSAFFHGADNGSMHFNRFAHFLGMEKYFGRNEYNNDADYDGQWGIFDEQFLSYSADELNQLPQPWISGIFTLSSHEPYTIPEKYKDIYNWGKLPMHNTILYADNALRLFFDKIKNTDWYNNTLFVLLADHTSVSLGGYYKNSVGHYNVPVIFYCPSDPELVGQNDNIIQHADVFPSVLDYLGYSGSIACFGNSVFSDPEENFSINYLNGLYHFVYDGYAVSFDGENLKSLHKYPEDRLLNNNLKGTMPEVELRLTRKLKAVIQQYNNKIIENKLVVD